jgi:hypothetical protein
MPSVVTYWQLPEDEEEFLDFLVKIGAVMAIPTGPWRRTRAELCPRPVARYIEQDDPSSLYFGLQQHIGEEDIEAREQDGEMFFTISDTKSCVIGYDRGRLRKGNKLGQSNIYAYWKYPSADATEMLDKNPDFVKWARRVLGWVRRFTPETAEVHGFPYRATKRVKAALLKGEIEVVLY